MILLYFAFFLGGSLALFSVDVTFSSHKFKIDEFAHYIPG